MADTLVYTPPKTVREFIKDHRQGEMFYDWIVGPVGSGKTTGIFFKLVFMAGLQEPGPDGIRRSRAVVVRNTAPQLKDTTLKSWFQWFKEGQAGDWAATDKVFTLRFGDVECEVLFRPLDTPQDVARVLSLEVTFALLDEFVQIPREIVEALAGRCGRYPAQKDGGATNWGMWGSSNPETEDNWWFQYLHEQLPANARYFLQPSGMSKGAENLENLPGKRGYYVQQSIGKTRAWIKQFVEAEWGFSVAGLPVVQTFNPEIHLSPTPLSFDPSRPLVIGLDPGISGMALIFGQDDVHGRLRVLGEIILSGVGVQRMMTDYLRPYMRQHFPQARVIFAPDPAAGNRAQSDERSVVDVLRKSYEVRIETNNRLAKRLEAIEHFTTRLTLAGPALLVDTQRCPVLTRALKGGWRYALDPKKGTTRGADPEKNAYSHPGDGFGYLCRYFHRIEERQTSSRRGVQRPPSSRHPAGSAYHAR